MAVLQGLYHPRSVAEATGLLAQDPQAKLLAGGATLVAMLNAGVIEPAALISLKGVAEIQGISTLGDGSIRIGAFTRHRDTAASAALTGANAAVRSAASQIANATVRNMGTIGGSIAFADPGLDYPAALVAARAEIEVAAASGRRVVPAADFFIDWYSTALKPGELVTAVLLPATKTGSAGVYIKHARVAGDYATVSVAACLDAGGAIHVAVGACGPAPLTSAEASAVLSADRSDSAITRAGALLEALADPLDDVRGSAMYRRLLIPRLLLRAVRAAEAAQRGDA
jgi:aerobic carbon-monoxide dehydrogenase medium subunit